MAIEPPTGRVVTSINVGLTYFDTSDVGGLHINNAGGGGVSRLRLSNCWFASSISGAGIQVYTGSSVSGLMVENSEFYDSVYGVQVEDSCTTDGFIISNSVFSGQSDTDITIGQNFKDFEITNCRTGNYGNFTASPTGVFINLGCSDFKISDNSLHNFTHNSGATAGKYIANNKGALTGSASYDPPSLASGAVDSTTVPTPGGALGDIVDCSFSLDLQGGQLSAYVSLADTVTVRLQNNTGSTSILAHAP